MVKLSFEMEAEYDSKNSERCVREVSTGCEPHIEEVILEFVNFLKGCTYSVELIQEYINYDANNFEVLKISESEE